MLPAQIVNEATTLVDPNLGRFFKGRLSAIVRADWRKHLTPVRVAHSNFVLPGPGLPMLNALDGDFEPVEVVNFGLAVVWHSYRSKVRQS
ncbi:hypothetical protein CURE108131_20800 [Cupriavidus respiraculi]|uniref:Uncharacterized protein n=1 Tax=Cupriavidus respiraculi TaxID=195930 RepID=A0ABN7YK52_9BURK|nr:hypothetical protein LMG21510_02194 [Cupriavidus respiraculi]